MEFKKLSVAFLFSFLALPIAEAATVDQVVSAQRDCLVGVKVGGPMVRLHNSIFPTRQRLYSLDRQARGETLGPRFEISTSAKDGAYGQTVAFQVRGDRLDVWVNEPYISLHAKAFPRFNGQVIKKGDAWGRMLEKESLVQNLVLVDMDGPDHAALLNSSTDIPSRFALDIADYKTCLKQAFDSFEN